MTTADPSFGDLEFSARARQEIMDTALAMIAGTMDLIRGMRMILALRHRCSILDGADQMFLPLIAGDSSTDHFPNDEERDLYDPTYLAELDSEKQAFLELDAAEIRDACRAIVRRLCNE